MAARNVTPILSVADEQVDQIRGEFEGGVEGEALTVASDAYELKRVHLPQNSPFVGRSIRQSGFREKYRAMVVGVERDGRRQVNPSSDLGLQQNDTLWIAGEASRLKELLAQIG